MCKACHAMIGCSCYCKKEWHANVNEGSTGGKGEFCTKCNHPFREESVGVTI